MRTIDIINLGCSKNLVDAEMLYTQLRANGVKVRLNPEEADADTLIINTCGFIGDAKEESVDAILDAVGFKNARPNTEVYVMGCLSQRYKLDLRKEIPEVDRFYGVNEIATIVKDLGYQYNQERLLFRQHSTLGHYAYLKIAEGCDRNCAFCAIPMIRGKQISLPIEDLIAEAHHLAKQGVRELILISQELTRYGIDLYKRPKLVELLHELQGVAGIDWIRLHYTYPNLFGKDLIQAIKELPKVCAYLDMPFQHFSDTVLEKMKRGHTAAEAFQLIDEIRRAIPDIALRTTLLVGHPGEDEQAFEKLLEAVASIRFDRLGVFTYSHEEDTHAFLNYSDDIDPDVKRDRADRVMQLQQQIAEEKNQEKIGKTLKVLIDSEDKLNYYGRTEYDSPEIDQEVILSKTGQKLKVGSFFDVTIIDASEFDLIGKLK